jgi:hypothetical protein
MEAKAQRPIPELRPGDVVQLRVVKSLSLSIMVFFFHVSCTLTKLFQIGGSR